MSLACARVSHVSLVRPRRHWAFSPPPLLHRLPSPHLNFVHDPSSLTAFHQSHSCTGILARLQLLLALSQASALLRQAPGLRGLCIPTPAPSDHPSRPSFDDAKDLFIHSMEVLSKDHSTEKKGKYRASSNVSCLNERLALPRGKFRCAITGAIDYPSLRPEL